MMILSSVTAIAAAGFAIGLLFGIAGALLLRRRTVLRRASVQTVTRFMYSGNLKQTNLLDAIQFLEIGRREGILHIYAGRRKGYITFAEGQIVDAFFRNAVGKEAVFQMLELDYGDFYFESKTISQPRIITESMMAIALEWDARRYGNAFDGGQDSGMVAAEAAQGAAPEGGEEVLESTAPAEEDSAPPVEPPARSEEATNSGSEKT